MPFTFTFELGLCGIFLEIKQSTARKGLLVDKNSFKRTTEPYAFPAWYSYVLQLSFFNVQTTSYFLDENRGSETFSFCCHLYLTRFFSILRPNTKPRYESIFLVSCLFVYNLYRRNETKFSYQLTEFSFIFQPCRFLVL